MRLTCSLIQKIPMKINNNSFWAGVLFVCVIGCTSAPDRIGDLDLKKWRSDRGGCEGIRKNQLADFKKMESQLLNKHIDEVGQLLGRPDIHQLGGRDQNFTSIFLKKVLIVTTSPKSQKGLK